MKKILVIFVILLLVTGCGEKKEEKSEYDEQKLKDKLIEYAKSVYESDSFPNKEPSDNVYILNLAEMTSIGKDTSMFVNENKEKCNDKETYATFRIVDIEKYEYDAFVKCD